MTTCTNHKLNVNAVAAIVRGARSGAPVRMDGAGEFTDGALVVRWLR